MPMQRDWIESLKRAGECGDGGCHPRVCVCDLCGDAAKEIEQLWEANHRMADGCEEQAAEIGRLNERVRKLTKLLDDQFGTPCEQLRHGQETDQLRVVLRETADRIENIAFLIPPPNAYTPHLVQQANTIRSFLAKVS